LFFSDHREQRSKALVLDDRGLIDPPILVEGSVGKVGAIMAQHAPGGQFSLSPGSVFHGA
jgi:hypothetical protein